MIVSNNISPTDNLYYIGGLILEILNDNYNKTLDILILYKKLVIKNKLTFVLYSYALDWLFISNLITVNEKGEIQKCS